MNLRNDGGPIYRLNVTLRDIRPPIWRRFLVPGGISLKRLHDTLQVVMGWYDCHLHLFEQHGNWYGPPDPEGGDDRISESRTKVSSVLSKPRDRIVYIYDFGDDWVHDVVLEAVLPPGTGAPYPWVEEGERDCPPEDVGGVPGYQNLLEAMADPAHPEHNELREWLGYVFDPEAYPVDVVNRFNHGERKRKRS